MATDTAPPPAPPRPNPRQLPLFAAGVAAAVAAYLAFPPPAADPAVRFARDLDALKTALDRRAGLENAIPVVAAAADRFPDRASSAHYLLGSAQLALAESSPGDTERWAAAAEQFALVDPAQLPDPADRKRSAFRRAKVQAATGAGDPAALLAALLDLPEGETAKGEYLRLLGDCYLRTDPPNVKKAADALNQYLSGQPGLPAGAVAAYKLRLGELQVSLNAPAAARGWLADIGPAAPPDVLARAKLQLGRLAANENNWRDAVKQFEAALASPALPADAQLVARYQAGVGLLRLNEPAAALPHLELAAKGTGPAAAAAAVRLAELIARDPARKGERGRAVDLLATAAGQPNSLVTPVELQTTFEDVIRVCLADADYPTAVRAADAYAPVAPAGKDKERRAEALSKWATELAANPATAADAAGKLKAAAADYLALADADPNPSGKADLLRRAADCFRRGGDESAALAAVDRLTRTTGAPGEIIAAAWLDKGEALLANNQFPDAVQALQKAMAGPGPSAMTARVKLAVAHLEQGRAKATAAATDSAKAEASGMIDLGAKLLAQVAAAPASSDAEKDAHQLALFEVGKHLFAQQNAADAEARFRQLIQTYPSGPFARQAQLCLGCCLMELAKGDATGGRRPTDADVKLAEAVRLFEGLSQSADDPFLRTEADLRLVNTVLMQQRYDEVPPLCDRLAARHAGKVHELILLSYAYKAHEYADRKDAQAQTLARMEQAFGKLTAADFPGGASYYTRDYWQTQWFDALKRK
ncbi:MAG: hypothetical protein U0871_23745 [Gemmataceae bacterium]